MDRGSGRVTVDTTVGDVTTSKLTVAVAEKRDSGNYSCWPSAGRPDSVIVHVIQGNATDLLRVFSPSGAVLPGLVSSPRSMS